MAANQTKKKKKSTKPKSAMATEIREQGKSREKSPRRQIAAVILFALAILLLCLDLIRGEQLWLTVHNFLLGIFGFTAWLLPFLLGYIAVVLSLNNPGRRAGYSITLTSLLTWFVGIAVDIFARKADAALSFPESLVQVYVDPALCHKGGVLGCLLGWPLSHFLGKTGAVVVILLLLFVFLMLVTGTGLVTFLRTVYEPVKSTGETAQRVYQHHKAAVEERRQAKFDVDIPLTDAERAAKAKAAQAQQPDIKDLEETLIDSYNNYAPRKKKETPPAQTAPDGEQAAAASAEGPQDPPPWEETPAQPPAETPAEAPAEFQTAPQTEGQPPAKQPAASMVPPGPSMEEIIDAAVSDQKKHQAAPASTLALEPQVEDTYRLPPMSLLRETHGRSASDIKGELESTAMKLVDVLRSFGVETRFVGASRGPSVTQYAIQPSAGVKINKITNLTDDIALNLGVSNVRIASIPNKSAVGIEVPNQQSDTVGIREILESDAFQNAKGALTVAMGRDISGAPVVYDLAKMPHGLVAGATGSGKSVCINSMIISLLYKFSPDDVKLLLIDPKVVEFNVYNGIPHLIIPVVTDPRKASGALGWAVTEMENRYKLFAESNVRDLNGYNRIAKDAEDMVPMPRVVIIIDELADLMMTAPGEVEDSICRLTQKARAAGMHLIVATQRPSVNVITGVIKANINTRIALAVSSNIDSRTILDMGGAEHLIGHGDMLFYPSGAVKPKRVQGCFVADDEVEAVVDFLKHGEHVQEYDETVMQEIERLAAAENKKKSKEETSGDDDADPMLPQAIEAVIDAGMASTSMLQRKLKLGYARAARIVDQMEQRGVVGPYEGAKPRQVLLSKQEWLEMQASGADETL